jgi:hypothetical protein
VHVFITPLIQPTSFLNPLLFLLLLLLLLLLLRVQC